MASFLAIIYTTFYTKIQHYQPIVNSSGTTTYDSYSKGFDRFPLRSSISNYFNTDSVWRTDKGDISGVMQLGFRKNIKRIVELCLEGHFARNGLIEKDLLWESLKKTVKGHDNQGLWSLDHLRVLSKDR
jgi:asparagine synthase (glutamine-hydrolysing)